MFTQFCLTNCHDHIQNILIQTNGLWLHLLVLFVIENLNYITWNDLYSSLCQNIEKRIASQ